MSSSRQVAPSGPAQPSAAPVYLFDEYRLDPNARTLTRDGRPVNLGSRAIQLLIALVENRDRVVGKQELIQLAWPRSTVVENNLPVTVNALRQAFENRLYIRNEYGKGYRFIAPVLAAVASIGATPLPPAVEAPPRAEQPSIAILPFSIGDKTDEVFGEGIAEDIIAALSRNRWLRVIARNSSFSYKRGTPGVDEIAQQLGVRYVLEGSIRRVGERVRVTAHLTDAITSTHLVSERWDRVLADIFAVQDEITARIVEAVRPTLLEAEQERSLRTHPDSVDAWLACQRGVWHMHQRDEDELRRSLAWFNRAMALDPRYAPAFYGLSRLLCHAGSGYSVTAPDAWQQRGEQLAMQAVWLDGRDSSAHAALAYARYTRGARQGAMAAANASRTLNTTDSYPDAPLGLSLIFSGRQAEGIDAVHSSIDLNPRNPLKFIRYMHIGLGLYFMNDLAAAEEHAAMMVRRWPDYFGSSRLMAMVLAETGREQEAARFFQRSVATWPIASAAFTPARMPWYRAEDLDRMLAAFRRAGWQGPSG